MSALKSSLLPKGMSLWPEQIDGAPQGAVSGRELAQLVVLPVVGEIGLGNYPVDPPVGDDGRAVEEHVVDLEG